MGGLWIHRACMIVLVPFVWAFASVAYLVIAPISAAEAVWLYGIKKHWNDQ